MTYANGTSQPPYQVERIETPAVVCRQCDKAMGAGTLPARKSLCGGCIQNDTRPRVNVYQKRTAAQRRMDHFLDKWLPLAMETAGGIALVVTICYWLGKALGWL